MRIVGLANFVLPASGGLRTALRHLGEGYAAAGHEPDAHVQREPAAALARLDDSGHALARSPG
jgi:hypothetical protein